MKTYKIIFNEIGTKYKVTNHFEIKRNFEEDIDAIHYALCCLKESMDYTIHIYETTESSERLVLNMIA